MPFAGRKGLRFTKTKSESLQVQRRPTYHVQKCKPKVMRLQKVSTYFLRAPKASLTIEAALAIPIVLTVFCLLLSFFQTFQVQARVQKILALAGDQMIESILVEDDWENLEERLGDWYVRQYIRKKLEPETALQSVDVSGCHFDLEERVLDLMVTYRIRGSMFGAYIQRSRRSLWSGIKGQESDRNEETYVFITKTGEVYHTSESCTHLRLRVEKVAKTQVGELRSVDGSKYYACERCQPTQETMVYITESGNRYHHSLDCSSLKRSYQRILLNEVGSRTLCSRCKG